jgi:aspartyl/asparaginyl beta-hydroxylase (cupin superfamily)
MAHAASSTVAERPWLLRTGKKLRPLVNRAAAAASLVPDAPVLDPGLLPWTAGVQAQWRTIRAEAGAVLASGAKIPALRDVSPDHARIAPDDSWRSFFLVGYGAQIAANCRHAPATTRLVEQIPGLNSAFFSILGPGCHIPRHKGVTKGLLTWHLALRVPRRPELCRMEVGGETVVWREGQGVLFDDTYDHEVWNESPELRLILLVQVSRPMRWPGRLLPDLFLWTIRRSAFVRDAKRNLAREIGEPIA